MKHQELRLLLPEVFQRTDQAGTPLYALLEVLASMTEPSEEILQQLAHYFNPYTTPEAFVPYIASWVDLDRIFAFHASLASTDVCSPQVIDSGCLRELIMAAARLSKLRGTAAGLKLFLETATGQKGFEIDENVLLKNNDVLPFHVKITAPAATQVHRTLIERIIEQEKPAYVTYNLEFSPQKAENNNG